MSSLPACICFEKDLLRATWTQTGDGSVMTAGLVMEGKGSPGWGVRTTISWFGPFPSVARNRASPPLLKDFMEVAILP